LGGFECINAWAASTCVESGATPDDDAPWPTSTREQRRHVARGHRHDRDVERLGRRGGLRSSAACLSAVFRQRDAAFVSLLNELRVNRASSDVARALEATNAL